MKKSKKSINQYLNWKLFFLQAMTWTCCTNKYYEHICTELSVLKENHFPCHWCCYHNFFPFSLNYFLHARDPPQNIWCEVIYSCFDNVVNAMHIWNDALTNSTNHCTCGLLAKYTYKYSTKSQYSYFKFRTVQTKVQQPS